MASTAILALRAAMPVVALAGAALVYRASKQLGGEIGTRLKIVGAGTFFLALYGVSVSLMAAGVPLFDYRSGAWSVAHVIHHLSFTVPTFIGLLSLWRMAR